MADGRCAGRVVAGTALGASLGGAVGEQEIDFELEGWKWRHRSERQVNELPFREDLVDAFLLFYVFVASRGDVRSR